MAYRIAATLIVVASSLWPLDLLAADEPAPAQPHDELREYRDLVGRWRGAGQPRRGSNRGAWQEHCEWQFQFADGRTELVCRSDDGRWIESASLTTTDQPGEWALRIVDGEGAEPQVYLGQRDDDGMLVLEAKNPAKNAPARISLRIVADGARLVVLYESRSETGRYSRLAEVGFTREGANFAAATYPECIVTGGRGTIAVEHQGKTYYVCCGGCRDLFLESPDEIIAEHAAQKEADAAKKKAAAERD